ncbi:hydroxymethylbilane synthase [Dehalobacterium formicoaceticum]|uniref:Porphobilinogen deaminase n=1 Tax=Dehalobacterium formicoaceticum TaxID=51515 RepID=A0ABT1Y7Y0_9FIRM|nr:hydroxymethylbilane synthase [Dehalobacterium formicoaceticum]MCR6546190.1 hydroxymethylbilane synthase [Dehalobacterium formicoaceticum]
MREIVIGTRDSALALWQARWVEQELKKHWPEYSFRVVDIKTKGDKILDVALAKIGDKGLFTKELEVKILDREIDLAVHSMKDVPTMLPEGLIIGAMCRREDPGDVLVSHKGYRLADLPPGAKVGTSSLRRRAQLLRYRPDFQLYDIRGNLNTRLAKMEKEDFDGIILAAAGVKRLGWTEKITDYLSYDVCLPAVGQGSIGIECRGDDLEVLKIIRVINDQDAFDGITAERAFLRKLEGGCQIPIGALGEMEQERMTLHGLVASLDGSTILRDKITGLRSEADQLGRTLADRLIDAGAEKILADVREALE